MSTEALSPVSTPQTKRIAKDKVRHYLEQWGSQSLAYSIHQPDLEYFKIPDVGLWPYRKNLGVTIALGNPLCDDKDIERFAQSFLDKHPRSLFAQVDGSTASALRAMALHLTPMGADALIDIPEFSLEGRSKRDIRHYQNKTQRASISIREVEDTPALRFELRQLSTIWIQSQKISTRELSFLIRPLAPEPESGTRIFVAIRGSQMMGFVVFDPMYLHGRCTGDTASILRALPHSPEGMLDSVILHAIDQFRAEGIQTLSLGVMPMHDMAGSAKQLGRGAWPLYILCRALHASPWQPLSNLRGLSFHKSRYRPDMVPVYVATTSPIGVIPMTALTRSCGLLP